MPILVVVDPQNDFVSPQGSLSVPDAGAAIPAIRELMGRQWSAIVFTADWHTDDSATFGVNHPGSTLFQPIPGTNLTAWPRHCVQMTAGAAFHEQIRPPTSAHVVRKGMDPTKEAYSGFEGFTDNGLTLETLLRQIGDNEVVVCGFATDYCVAATAIDAAKRGFHTTVHLAACRGVAIATTEQALVRMGDAGVLLDESDPIRVSQMADDLALRLENEAEDHGSVLESIADWVTEERHAAAVDRHFLNSIVETIGLRPRDPRVAEFGCLTLQMLGPMVGVGTGAPATIVGVLKIHKGNARVCRRATGAIASITSTLHGDILTPFGGAISPLVAVIQAHAETPHEDAQIACGNAFIALANLMDPLPNTIPQNFGAYMRIDFAEAGGIVAAVNILAKSNEDPSTCDAACLALRSLTQEVFRMECVEAGVVPALEIAMTKHAAVHQNAAAVLAILNPAK